MTDKKTRINIIGIILLLLAGVILLRLGYLQLVRHDYFTVLASESHFRKFEITPKRGRIFVHSRGEVSPVAMNRNLKTLYADTRYVYDLDALVASLKELLGQDYREKLESSDGYVELEKELPLATANQVEELGISGIGLSDSYKRVYPEEQLLSQVLGFVNTDGEGQYGIEEFFNEQLEGVPGMFDSQTDSNGVPLATSDNIQRQPLDGHDIVLTIDRNIQSRVESSLKEGVEATNADSAHAVVMNPNDGRIVAMANYPSFNPNEYSKVEDYSRFLNTAASGLFEPGSGFKVFTVAAGLESGAIKKTDTYHDNGHVQVADARIQNVESGGGGVLRTMTDIITYSVNTGVVHILSQLGNGSINDQAKSTLYAYFKDKFRLSDPTGIEQPGEPEMSMAAPEEVGPVNYANMTFGQGITTTMTRMAASMSAIVNGGTMYQPRLVDYLISQEGEITTYPAKVIAEDVVSSATSETIREMMATVVEDGGGYAIKQLLPEYKVGGKTGTAQVPSPDGGYYNDRDIGSFIGFAPVDQPKYLIMVRIDNPTVPGYAGSAGAGPIFADILEWLVKYDGISP